MLYESFNRIRETLKGIPELKAIQWYNVQYEGTIYTSPIAFIEFPDRIPLEQVAGEALRGDFAVRIHIASVNQSAQDSSIPDATIINHEAIAKQALSLMQGKQIEIGSGRTTALRPRGWQHYHKYRGWMVTFVDFGAAAFGL